MKRSKRTWLLKAGIIFLAGVLGIFLLLPAGSLFAQVGSLEGRWVDEVGDMGEIRGTTAVVIGGESDGQVNWRDIAQVGDNQWTALQLLQEVDHDTGEVLEEFWVPITIVMSPDGNSLTVTGVFEGEEFVYVMSRVATAPPAAQPR